MVGQQPATRLLSCVTRPTTPASIASLFIHITNDCSQIDEPRSGKKYLLKMIYIRLCNKSPSWPIRRALCVTVLEWISSEIMTSSFNIAIYPVHGANLTLIQPMWSAYPYAPTSVYGIHMPLLPYMVIQPIVLGMALLRAAIDSALSQGPLLWRHNDMTVIVSRNTRGRERDTRQRLNNANARRLQTVCRIQCDLFHISGK